MLNIISWDAQHPVTAVHTASNRMTSLHLMLLLNDISAIVCRPAKFKNTKRFSGITIQVSTLTCRIQLLHSVWPVTRQGVRTDTRPSVWNETSTVTISWSSPPWQANSRSANQELARPLRTQKVNHRVRKSPLLLPVPSCAPPIHTSEPYFPSSRVSSGSIVSAYGLDDRAIGIRVRHYTQQNLEG
jgi:hypothetical protein